MSSKQFKKLANTVNAQICALSRGGGGGAGVANKLERPLSVETQICVHGTYLHFVFQCSVVTNG